jgi:hypothetical protein
MSMHKENKKGLKLLQSPLTVFEILIVSFLPKALQNARGHHFPHSSTLGAPPAHQ